MCAENEVILEVTSVGVVHVLLELVQLKFTMTTLDELLHSGFCWCQ